MGLRGESSQEANDGSQCNGTAQAAFDPKNLRIYFQNVSGISSMERIEKLRASLSVCPDDVVVLIETWFEPDKVKNSKLFDENRGPARFVEYHFVDI